MIPVYVSNGAILTRYNGRDYHLIAKYMPLLNADGMEFLMYFCWADEVDEVRRVLKGLKLYIPVMHLDKNIGEALSEHGAEGRDEAFRLLKRDLDTACLIGAKKLVLHLWNGPCSDRNFDPSLEMYGDMAALAEKRGLCLTVENVTCRENLSLDHLAALAKKYPFARFTYDTKMAHLHGENALLATDKYRFLLSEGYISHLHVNDSVFPTPGMDRLPIMHIGDGKVDFDAFFALVHACNYAGTATVESTSVNTDGSVDVDKLNRSLARVRRGLNGRETRARPICAEGGMSRVQTHAARKTEP